MKDAILNIPGYGTGFTATGGELDRIVSSDGDPERMRQELRFIPAIDLRSVADGGATASLALSPMGGVAWPEADGATFKVFRPWVTGTFRHELGHCVFWSLVGNDQVAVHTAYKAALTRFNGCPKALRTTEDELFMHTSLPSLRALDNIDEFFAESYRRYHIHAIRSARGVPKPALSVFRAASPLMADFFDRRYAAALEVQ